MIIDSFVSACSFASADFSTSIGFFASAGLFIFASPFAGALMLIVLYMTKFFYIGKLITSANNTIAMKTTKSTIWVAGVPFPSVDKVWQYILGISDLVYQLKIIKDIMHQQVLLVENIGFKYKIIIRLLKKD